MKKKKTIYYLDDDHEDLGFFKEITEAYECLSDPKRKQRYDSGQDIEDEDRTQADAQQVDMPPGLHRGVEVEIFDQQDGADRDHQSHRDMKGPQHARRSGPPRVQ